MRIYIVEAGSSIYIVEAEDFKIHEETGWLYFIRGNKNTAVFKQWDFFRELSERL